MHRLFLGLVITLAVAGPLSVSVSAGGTGTNHQDLVLATKDFGYWMTYFARNSGKTPSERASPAEVNANIAKHVSIRSDLPSGPRVGFLTGRMHLMNTPNGFQYRIVSFTGARAVETIHWLFGSNPHTPVVRVVWTMSPVGWSIIGVRFLRLS